MAYELQESVHDEVIEDEISDDYDVASPQFGQISDNGAQVEH